jgi:hypothetical protein
MCEASPERSSVACLLPVRGSETYGNPAAREIQSPGISEWSQPEFLRVARIGYHSGSDWRNYPSVDQLSNNKAKTVDARLRFVEPQFALLFHWQPKRDDAMRLANIVSQFIVYESRFGIVLDPLHPT